jgi:hypothetical protein
MEKHSREFVESLNRNVDKTTQDGEDTLDQRICDGIREAYKDAGVAVQSLVIVASEYDPKVKDWRLHGWIEAVGTGDNLRDIEQFGLIDRKLGEIQKDFRDQNTELFGQLLGPEADA